MAVVYFYQGLPASGKDTDALQRMAESNGKLKRINKDILREMIDGSKFSKEREKHILKARNMLLEYYLSEGYDVAITDTNYNPYHWDTVSYIARRFNAEVKMVRMDTSVYECLRRNAQRPNPVPDTTIWNMYRKYVYKKPVMNENLPNAYIVDMDGTLALPLHRHPYEYEKVLQDELNEPVERVVRQLAPQNHIIIVSGRENVLLDGSTVQERTEQWLYEKSIPYDKIYLRKKGDHRPDHVVKKEIYETYIENNYNVLGAFDDRASIVELWRSLNITTFDVAGGTF